ncbi:MAG: hypothetical protein COA47_08070 [Robiginitomaculum sp.]|nr:MAG: hypothetical protein COA47_08070 [Robiginitomaculum sp.]
MSKTKSMLLILIWSFSAPQVSAHALSGSNPCYKFGYLSERIMLGRQAGLEKHELLELIASTLSGEPEFAEGANMMIHQAYESKRYANHTDQRTAIQTFKQEWVSGCQGAVASQAKAARPNTIAGYKEVFLTFQYDKTGEPNEAEAKKMLDFLGAERWLTTSKLVIGRFPNKAALSIWTDAYGFSSCYSLRFGSNLKNSVDTSYHKSNDTYFEICKKPGDSKPYFDRKQLQ